MLTTFNNFLNAIFFNELHIFLTTLYAEYNTTIVQGWAFYLPCIVIIMNYCVSTFILYIPSDAFTMNKWNWLVDWELKAISRGFKK